jgi:hypothetical protein
VLPYYACDSKNIYYIPAFIYEDYPDSLATKHLLDVGILSPLLLLTWISD